MIDSSIDAIIFDFGGVIINIDYNATIHAFKQLGITNFDELYSQAAQSDLFNAIETGGIESDEFISGVAAFLPDEITKEEIKKAWNAMILDVPKEKLSLLKQLKEEGYRLFLLSNTNAIHIDLAYAQWKKVSEEAPNAYFEHIFLSHEVGLRKPDPEIFKLVCDTASLDPEHTLFIDDSIQHINGAESIGLRTYLLDTNGSLQEVFS